MWYVIAFASWILHGNLKTLLAHSSSEIGFLFFISYKECKYQTALPPWVSCALEQKWSLFLQPHPILFSSENCRQWHCHKIFMVLKQRQLKTMNQTTDLILIFTHQQLQQLFFFFLVQNGKELKNEFSKCLWWKLHFLLETVLCLGLLNRKSRGCREQSCCHS